MSIILGIETSCDETAAALVDMDESPRCKIMSNIVFSQVAQHERFGGVVPEVASRMHFELIDSIVAEAVDEANISLKDIDAVAVTVKPGLIGALLVGVSFAKTFAYALNKPLVPVNHISGHIAANLLDNPALRPPFLCLVASGGHSLITHVEEWDSFTVLGSTLDDAAGEAFDKVARVLGFGYPGGQAVSRAAVSGNPKAVAFPRSIFGLDFSFSGLKTAVINHVHKESQGKREINPNDIAASFQEAATDVLTAVAMKGCEKQQVNKLAIAGGVAANTSLREKLEKNAKERGIEVFFPSLPLCADNGAMIACAGYFGLVKGKTASLDLNARARM